MDNNTSIKELGLGISFYIDDTLHTVNQSHISGAELRSLAKIDKDDGIWEMIPGENNDKLIQVDDIIELKPGMQFYTGKKIISPRK